MSPALNPKFYQIKMRIFQGQDLPMMDSGIGFLAKEKIDAYMKCDFKGKKYTTEVIKQEKGGPPVNWNTEFWLPAQLPVLAPKILVRLMDEDDIGSDEVAGTLWFKTKDIIEAAIKGQEKGFVWKNIYGSPLG
jgi:Ca2+-dependent lipid-binding protein